MPASSDRGQELLEQLVNDASVLQYDEPAGVDAACCWYCGCTEDDACILETDLEDDDGDAFVTATCTWYRKPDHRGFGVCSNPECVKEYLADPGAP